MHLLARKVPKKGAFHEGPCSYFKTTLIPMAKMAAAAKSAT